MEKPLRRRRRQQGRNLLAAARLPEDHDARRVAAEVADAVAHPFERRDHVHQAADTGRLEFLGRADRRQVRVAETRQAVVHGDDDHVAEERQLTAVVHRPVAGAGRPPPAVERHEHGAPGVVVDTRCPDVQRQAVLAYAAAADVFVPLNELRVVGAIARRGLWRDGPVADATPHPGPGRGLARRHEPIFAGGVRAVGNAAKHLDAGVGHPADDAGGGLDVEEQRSAHSCAGGRRRGRAAFAGACASTIDTRPEPTATALASPAFMTARLEAFTRPLVVCSLFAMTFPSLRRRGPVPAMAGPYANVITEATVVRSAAAWNASRTWSNEKIDVTIDLASNSPTSISRTYLGRSRFELLPAMFPG